MSASIVMFDGVCNLCNGAVRFIIHYDPHARFLFTALQSEPGAEMQRGFNIPEDVDSIILIEGEHVYTHSTAALRIARGLVGLWPLLYVLILVPRPIRDVVYRFIARNRYRWFGKKDVCMIPTPALKARFL